VQAYIIDRYGGPDRMHLAERPEPAVGPTDVRIRVHAASLNPIDFKLRDGKAKMVLKPAMPLILGCDVAGTIDQVGSAVTAWKSGDEVFARLEKDRMGALAEWVSADQSVVARRPARATWEQAASIPLAGLTALQALRDIARLERGQRVLIHAGAGGVGTLAIQIAHRLGAWVATTTSTKNVDLVTSLGADLAVDYTKEQVADRVRDLDVVLDTLGAASEVTSLGLCRRGGVVVGASGMPDRDFARAHLPAFARPVVWLATRARRAAEARSGATFRYVFMSPSGAQLAELASWVDDGTLRPVVHQVFPFAEVKDAFAELERGRARGKIVVLLRP
jgi:NADPH:quinone reductase-like Zn-dependent oxidoreductase